MVVHKSLKERKERIYNTILYNKYYTMLLLKGKVAIYILDASNCRTRPPNTVCLTQIVLGGGVQQLDVSIYGASTRGESSQLSHPCSL